MTADSEIELSNIRNLFPGAKIIIHIKCDIKYSEFCLGSKFGCEPDDEAIELIRFIKELDLSLHGFNFHVRSSCGELNAYSRGIGMCKKLITISRFIGFKDVQLIDMERGFPGETGYGIDNKSILCRELRIKILYKTLLSPTFCMCYIQYKLSHLTTYLKNNLSY